MFVVCFPRLSLPCPESEWMVYHDGNGRLLQYAASVASPVRDDTTKRERSFRDGTAQNVATSHLTAGYVSRVLHTGFLTSVR